MSIKQLTELLAVEYGPYGVRINAVAPGYTLTENLNARIDAGLRDGDQIKRSGALEMFILPEHIADAIQFLASDKAAAITGVTLPVDAGMRSGENVVLKLLEEGRFILRGTVSDHRGRRDAGRDRWSVDKSCARRGDRHRVVLLDRDRIPRGECLCPIVISPGV